MQAVGSVLSNLKNMAQDMGNEISKQNKQLDKITNKVLVTLDFFDREGLDRFRRQTPNMVFMQTFFFNFYLQRISFFISFSHFQAESVDIRIQGANKRTEKLLK